MSKYEEAPRSGNSPRLRNVSSNATKSYHPPSENGNDFRRINDAARTNGTAILEYLLPDGKPTTKGEWSARNPTREDKHSGSFSVNIATGKFKDFASDDKGGDYVALWAFCRQISQGSAAQQLAEFLHIPGLGKAPAAPLAPKPRTPPPAPVAPVAPVKRPITPIPESAMDSKPTLMGGRIPPSGRWQYRDAQGRLLCEIWRREPITSKGETKKVFNHLTYWPNGWDWKGLPEPYPLYHLDQLAQHPQAPVLFCEGEKAADAARRLLPDYITTTTLNGAQSPGKTDFSTLQGRAIYIWPDHDDSGRTYAERIAQLTSAAGAASVHILDVAALADDLPEKWDAADAEISGWTEQQLTERLRWREWTPEPAPDPAPVAESDPDPEPEPDPNPDPAPGPAAEDAPSGNKKPTQADLLLQIAEQFEYFHDPSGNGYARVYDNTGKRVYPVRSKGFKDILRRDYLKLTRRGIGTQALTEIIDTLDAMAQFENEEAKVYKRAARIDDTLYIDLADPENHTVVITAVGWTLTQDPPIDFVRNRTMTALPIPARKGDIQALQPFLNVDDDGLTLCKGWMLGALRGRGSYPILSLMGQAGAGKTTVTKVLRAFTDPSCADMRSIPATEQDITAIAANNHVLAFDNLSRLDSDPSDWLCKISTGHGYGKRANYTDFDEAVIQTCNPIIVNGISPAFNKPDFVSRLLSVELDPLSHHEENREAEFWAAFDAAKPAIFGGIIDALRLAMQHESNTTLGFRVRLGDFARWVVAAEPALNCPPGAFLQAMGKSQREAYRAALESSPVASALYEFMQPDSKTKKWNGSSSHLLFELTQAVGDKARDRKSWPQTSESLSKALIRLAPALRESGLVIDSGRSSDTRWISIFWQAPPTARKADNQKPADADEDFDIPF